MSGLSESQFYMWRTIFALAHADDVVSPEEVRFMAETLEDVPFSGAQQAVLNKDVGTAQDIEAMFKGISDAADQAAFFRFAHELVHVDGEYGPEEQAVMLRLKEIHLRSADVDELVGSVALELEPEEVREAVGDSDDDGERGFKRVVYSFRDAFLKGRFSK